MHEASIAQGILDTALGALPDKSARITQVTIVAGVFSGVERQSLEMYWSLLTKDTPAEGSQLLLKVQSAQLVCKACGESTAYDNPRQFQEICSRCGGKVHLQGGSQLYLESLEVEEDET